MRVAILRNPSPSLAGATMLDDAFQEVNYPPTIDTISRALAALGVDSHVVAIVRRVVSPRIPVSRAVPVKKKAGWTWERFVRQKVKWE